MDGREAAQSGAADDLFDYDFEFDDLIRERNDRENATEQHAPAARQAADDANLGLDEEIKVTKARRPVPKLDEEKLLSQNGIPRLRKKARKLNLHGKGHEYSDTMKLLNFYQLWLDDLHPKVKFADGLAIIEKLGHTKRLQVMRKEWIYERTKQERDQIEALREENSIIRDESQPMFNANSENNGPQDNHMTEAWNPTAAGLEGDLFVDEDNGIGRSTRVLLPDNDDDGLDALLAEPSLQAPASSNNHATHAQDEDVDMLASEGNARVPPQSSSPSKKPANEPPEDDLDALLAEEDEISALRNKATSQNRPVPDDFEDDWEAINDLGM